jgi:PAS domain S-box-containing protein
MEGDGHGPDGAPDTQGRDALTESEERYRELTEGMPLLVCSTLPDGTITYINELAAAVAGRTPAELIGVNANTLVDTETAELLDTARRAVTADNPVESHEESHRDPHGTMHLYEWTNRGSFDGEGRLVRIQAIGRDVTERRRAEEALLESEQRLRLANKATNDVVWDLDIVNDAEHWIATGATVFGWTDIAEGPVPDAWWSERLHPDDAARVHESYHAVIDDPAATSWVEEYRFRRADGSYAEVLDRGHVLRDSAGAARRVIGAMLDISERRRAEQELQASRDLMQLIIRHDPNAIAVFDDELRYVFVSDRFLDDYGVRGEDVAGKRHYEVFPEIPERWREIHRRVLGGSIERAVADPFPRQDGRVDWVSWECRPWHRADGGIGGMILYSELITERKEAEELLRQSRGQYETFINATDDIAFLKDDQLRYIIVNPANAAYFGRSAEEIVGHTDDELMPAKAAESCRHSDVDALRSGGLVITTETQGDRVYESRKFPVALTDGRTGIGGYVRDVSEQRRAEGEIKRLASGLERRVAQRTAQLEATNRELESFAYSISHDLRSPLRALDGFSEILLQDYGEALDDAGRDYLRRIKGAANHMAGLMDGLLQLSRLNRDDLDVEDVDLTALATSFVAELHERDPARDVVVDVAPGLVARADPKLIRAALENLLVNAWKFTSRHETALIEFGADRDGGGVTFFVRDDGAGFDMRYAKNLFGAFQRLHTPDQFEGTGIGLATVQRIVHRHGGAVWAEGEIEKGATFWFTLEPPDGV